jgi:ribonuclease BN (tRNA processing enzyme)
VSLKLTILGSAAAWSEHVCQPSSGYLVEHPDGALVLDLGQGSFASLMSHRDPSTLTAVVISHEHADHHVDLIPLRHLLRYGYNEPRSIGLHVPDELRRRYDVFNGEEGFLDLLVGPALGEGIRDVGPFRLECRRVTHSQMSYAFRVTDAGHPDAAGLVYSGDCGRADDLEPLIHVGDTVLCEAFWATREPVPSANHLTAAQAADVAQRTGAGCLVLTHILDAHQPESALEAARGIFTGQVLLAEPDLVVDIPAAV